MNLFNTWLFTMLCPSCIKVQNSQYCKTAKFTGDIVINLLPLCENATNEAPAVGNNPINAVVNGSIMTFQVSEGANTTKPQVFIKGDSPSGALPKNGEIVSENGLVTFSPPGVATDSLVETIAQVHVSAPSDGPIDGDNFTSESEVRIHLIDNVETEPICRPVEAPVNPDIYDYF